MKKLSIILSILLISILLVSGCIGQEKPDKVAQNQTTQNQTIKQIDDKNTSNSQSKYYDDLDASLNELNTLEEAG